LTTKDQKDNLFSLIKSLTKSEKRQFKLYVGRLGVNSESKFLIITKYFNDRLPKFNLKNVGFREKLWLYKAHLWYSFLMQDFLNCYKYASKWVDLFHQNPSMINLNPVFYLKGNNYLLESIYFIRNKPKFEKKLDHFISTVNNIKFNKDENVSTLIFLSK